MAHILLETLITTFSFCMIFSFQFETCLKWPNYGVRYHNYCHVSLRNNVHLQPYLFRDAIEYCKSNDGIFGNNFFNGSHRTLLHILIMAGVGQTSGVLEKVLRFTLRPGLPDHECSKSHTTRPGCEVFCAFKTCPLGKFGFPECQSKCRCEDAGRCDIATGACLETGCVAGFFGPPACRKCNCRMNTQCHMETGACPSGCKAGWSGKSCQKWKCRSEKCLVFARLSRRSSCEIGWTGENCQTPLCPEGFYGPPGCNETCSCNAQESCSPADGKCGDPCAINSIGRRGPQCQELNNSNFTCPPFSYGLPGCDYFCFCYKNAACDVTTGQCPSICLPGWKGPHCDQRLCPYGNYSYPECHLPCRCEVVEACNSLTGVCEIKDCQVWENCTEPSQSVNTFPPRASILWYLITSNVVFVSGTVVLILILCIQKKSSETKREGNEE